MKKGESYINTERRLKLLVDLHKLLAWINKNVTSTGLINLGHYRGKLENP